MKLFLFSLCAPLLGTFLSPMIAFFILGIALFFKSGTSLYAFGIPTIIATMCWLLEQRTRSRVFVAKIALNVVLPLSCMLFFIVHPIGANAFAYTLYWLIPPILTFIKHKNMFINLCNDSLRITFVSHAVGSVLWLYMTPTIPVFWLALIPTVALERFRLAFLTAVLVGAIRVIERYILHGRGDAVKDDQVITGTQNK